MESAEKERLLEVARLESAKKERLLELIRLEQLRVSDAAEEQKFRADQAERERESWSSFVYLKQPRNGSSEPIKQRGIERLRLSGESLIRVSEAVFDHSISIANYTYTFRAFAGNYFNMFSLFLLLLKIKYDVFVMFMDSIA